jgi:hypothetical protein
MQCFQLSLAATFRHSYLLGWVLGGYSRTGGAIMAGQQLTKGRIDAARPAMRKGRPTTKLLFDRKVIGFGLKVSAGGAKTYFVQ